MVCLEMRHLEGNWVWIMSWGWSSHDRIGAHIKGWKAQCSIQTPGEDKVRKQPFLNKESGFHQTPKLLILWSYASQHPELWEINVCRLAAQSMVVCYSYLERLRELLNKLSKIQKGPKYACAHYSIIYIQIIVFK